MTNEGPYESAEERVTFNPGVVANRMRLLEQLKPDEWNVYTTSREAGMHDLDIDFSQPVPMRKIQALNSVFNIDAEIFFMVSDEEIKKHPEMFFRAED